MSNNIANHLPLQEREGFLRDNCDSIERLNYMKKFTEEDIVSMKSRLSTVAIEMDEIEDEKKDVNAHFKARTAPLKSEHKLLLTNIKQKAQLVVEDCYKFVDRENGRVEFYNQIGDLVDSRPIAPEERQSKMFPIRSGTNE